MIHTVLRVAHVLAVVLWVGGMAFAHFFLRPELATLEPPQRLRLMHGVLRRFFGAVLAAVIVALATGLVMIGLAHRVPGFAMPPHWTLMSAVGLVMMGVFAFIRMRPFVAMGAAVGRADWPAAGAALAQIRQLVTLNLVLGTGVFVIALAR